MLEGWQYGLSQNNIDSMRLALLALVTLDHQLEKLFESVEFQLHIVELRKLSVNDMLIELVLQAVHLNIGTSQELLVEASERIADGFHHLL